MALKPPQDIGTIVAERELTLTTEQGERKVFLRLSQPFLETAGEGHPFWRCWLQFEGIGPTSAVHPVAGVDSLQTIVLGLDLARKLLAHEAKKAGGTISAYDDLDIISPSAKLLDFYGEAAGEALKAVRQAESELRAASDPGLRRLHAEMRRLVEKYGDK